MKPTLSLLGCSRRDIIAVKHLDTPEKIVVTRPDGSAGSEVSAILRFRDAILYCLRTARSLGKPVVINLSLGDSSLPGDGLDDDARFVDELLAPTKASSETNFPSGAILVKSAGNEGDPSSKLTSRIVIPASGELVLPVRVGEARAGGETRQWLNCKRVTYKPAFTVHFWYRRAAAPLAVTFSFRTSEMDNYSAEVAVGGTLELGVERKEGTPVRDSWKPATPNWHRFGLTHENNPPVRHPSGAIIQRNHVMFTVKPKESGPSFGYCQGIHELLIRGPAGTEFFAHSGKYAWTHGIGGIIHTWPVRRDGTEVNPPDLTHLTEQTCIDPMGQHVITVASYNDTGGPSPFNGLPPIAPHEISESSSRGPLRDYSDQAAPIPVFSKPDIAAPGVDISSAMAADAPDLGIQWPWWYWGDRFQELSGTSMATPVVAGLVAVMLQKNPNLNATQVKAILRAAARPAVNPAAAPASTHAYGAGMIDGMPSHVNTP